MGQFNRDRNQGGGRSFGGGDRYNNGRSDRPQMYPATCSNCGNACEVPFKPTGAKPVLCNNCFRASGGPDRRDDRPRFDKPRFDKPRFDKPRFDDRGGAPTPSFQPQFKEQFESLNYKLDKILKILMGTTEAEMPKKAKEAIVEVIIETPVTPVNKKSREEGSGSARKKAPKKKVEKKAEPVMVEPATPESAAEEPTV